MAELTTLARPYAKAAFEFALHVDMLGAWSGMLGLAATVVESGSVKAALASPSITAEQQSQILLDLCGEELDASVQNFIKVLSENKRLTLLPQIVSLFEILKANQEKTVDVSITAAFPLTSEAEQNLANALKARLQREVNLHSDVDKKLIGGIVVRAGDLVIDGSVRGKLGKLAEAMNS